MYHVLTCTVFVALLQLFLIILTYVIHVYNNVHMYTSSGNTFFVMPGKLIAIIIQLLYMYTTTGEWVTPAFPCEPKLAVTHEFTVRA